MAVCNLFNELSSPSGNFIMFSQYVEDITHNFTDGDNYKVVPTGFVALDIKYDELSSQVKPNGESLNVAIPKYLQNYFENGCAYGRNNINTWTSLTARNLFWNCMFDGGFTHAVTHNETKRVKEIVYYGDINMHSYNEHQGMGYGEIYCYIPTDAARMNCHVVVNSDRKANNTNSNTYLEGFDGNDAYQIGGYSTSYFYNDDYVMPFDDDSLARLSDGTETKYNINTIVVLYSVFKKLDNDWVVEYASIPMGMYIAGNFDGTTLSNTVTKYVATSYGSGTSYGLRICTRFSVTSMGAIINTDIVTDDSGYTNICQLMTAMNENLSRMLEISKSAHDTTQGYKETLASIKNNRTNVPYVKKVNGIDCWFVNGRFVAAVNEALSNITINCNHTCDDDVIDPDMYDFGFASSEDVIGALSSTNQDNQ